MANLIRPIMSHTDEARQLLQQIYKTDANIYTDSQRKLLMVEIHHLTYWKDDKILKNVELTKGRYFSERVLTYLIEEKGFSREEAYSIVQKVSFESLERDISFKDALREEIALREVLKDEEIDNLFDLKWFIRYVDYIYKRSGIEDDKS